MQDKLVLIRNWDRSTFIGKVADFDKRGSVTLEHAMIMLKKNDKARGLYGVEMCRGG